MNGRKTGGRKAGTPNKATGASVGVHGASDKNGQETDGSNSATVAMAKIVKELGVPADIIGRMVVTAPDQMVWLSPNNLRAMGTTMTGRLVQSPTANAPLCRLRPRHNSSGYEGHQRRLVEDRRPVTQRLSRPRLVSVHPYRGG
jgi:hypothetical protein